MNTGVFLSYKGLGVNLLHLAYCHQIAKKFGPIKLLTLCPKLKKILEDDPLIDEIICIENYYKKFFDIIKLSKNLRKYKLENLFIFYPSVRYYLAAKFSRINNIYTYPLFKKKNLHLVNTAKKFTEKTLNIKNCPTDTDLYISEIDKKKASEKIYKNKKNIIIGAGSSGPTQKWGTHNFVNLIKLIQQKKNSHFFILCGPKDTDIAKNIIKEVGDKHCTSLSNKTLSEIIPLISVCDLYIGNDSFGHHVASLCSKPSIIILLDSPRAYSDWSTYQNRIVSIKTTLDKINHGSYTSPNVVSVEQVFEKVLSFIK